MLPQRATAACPAYARRRPEFTPCYKILQEHLNTFIAARDAESRPLPKYVLTELDAYLRCGIPAHGFLRLRCPKCREEKVVAFSCKKRGFCPACCAKRMAETSAHLIENVLPLVPYRQFVLSFPIPLRYWLNSNRKLFAKIHSIVIRQTHRYYRKKALALGLKEPVPGSISFTQRWGSACNLNPHLHILCPDGVYYWNKHDEARFAKLSVISNDEVATLITAISTKVRAYLVKCGYLDKDGKMVDNRLADPHFAEHDALALATQCSLSGKIAFGPNAGKKVTRIGSGFGYFEEIPLAQGERCFSIHGYSLHANTRTRTHQRERLGKLIEYLARGPLSNERLEITTDGKVKLALKTHYRDGTSHLLFTPEEFIEKIVALIPPPRLHLVRWAGVFGSHSKFRRAITLKPDVKKGFQFRESKEDEEPQLKNYSWAKMLAKVFKIDVTQCDKCGGELRPMGALVDAREIERYLAHVGIDPLPPPRAPPRFDESAYEFTEFCETAEPVIEYD
jgi:hypothetical protein